MVDVFDEKGVNFECVVLDVYGDVYLKGLLKIIQEDGELLKQLFF